jgi:hypothetical protein
MLNELGNIIWNHEWERQCEERDILREKNENATSEEYTINSWLQWLPTIFLILIFVSFKFYNHFIFFSI